MNIQLTEQIICDRANEQSFQKGLEYYHAGAVYNPSWQSTPNGIALIANCSGSSDYRLRVVLDAGGVSTASCTCPYDWDGDCKHIVALLLTYLHEPGKFPEQKSVPDLLSGLEKDALVAVITRLVERLPDLYDELEIVIPAVKVTAQPKPTATVTEKQQTQVSEPMYRKLVKKILKQNRHEYEYDYYDRGSAPAYLDDLEETLQTAMQALSAGDAEGALIILRVLFEETIEEYDGEMDYDGDVAGFIQSLGMPLAETILSVKLNAQEREELQDSLQNTYDELDEYVESSQLDVVFDALEYGWNKFPETGMTDDGEETWMSFEELEQARLNVLERQSRIDEFLQLAQKVDTHRYVLKLLELGRIDEAIAASQILTLNLAILDVAQKLRTAGRLEAAINLAERGLELGGHYLHELATWLAPLEESQGRNDMALVAYRSAYNVQPAINLYRHVKRLSGKDWENLRPTLMQKINEAQMPQVLTDIHLEERNWDAAIALAEKYTWFGLLDKVSDAVIPVRPDWVINTAIRQATSLIAPTQSKLYPDAAKWLARAKKAHQHKNQMADWQAYIDNLRITYARRPALQKAIANL